MTSDSWIKRRLPKKSRFTENQLPGTTQSWWKPMREIRHGTLAVKSRKNAWKAVFLVKKILLKKNLFLWYSLTKFQLPEYPWFGWKATSIRKKKKERKMWVETMASFASTEATWTKSQSVITIDSYACNCHRWHKQADWTKNGQFLGNHNKDMIEFGYFMHQKEKDKLFGLN